MDELELNLGVRNDILELMAKYQINVYQLHEELVGVLDYLDKLIQKPNGGNNNAIVK